MPRRNKIPLSSRQYYCSTGALRSNRGDGLRAHAHMPQSAGLRRESTNHRVVTLSWQRASAGAAASSTEAWRIRDIRSSGMLLVLQPSAPEQADLDALVAAQQDPGSAALSPVAHSSRIRRTFRRKESDLAQVTAWLSSHGFTIDEIPAGRRLIVFSGSAGQVSDTFHTELHLYRVNGEPTSRQRQDPQIPAAWPALSAALFRCTTSAAHPRCTSVRTDPRSPSTRPEARTICSLPTSPRSTI